jgi:hypothetical protein
MSIPTPDEITSALATLHRMPYVRSDTTLAEIKGANTPFWWMTRDILGQLDSDSLPNPGELASILATCAARHGLRITTDPGRLIGYAEARQHGVNEDWVVQDGTWPSGPQGLADARKHKSTNTSLAAVYLLPEGGKA